MPRVIDNTVLSNFCRIGQAGAIVRQMEIRAVGARSPRPGRGNHTPTSPKHYLNIYQETSNGEKEKNKKGNDYSPQLAVKHWSLYSSSDKVSGNGYAAVPSDSQ